MHVEVLLQTSIFLWSLSVTLNFDLEALVHARDTASFIGEQFYEVSSKFPYGRRRYAPDKNWTSPARPPRVKL
jgi:hypothetical protein